MPEIVGENIDRACTIEMRPGSGMPRGIIHHLYSAARRVQGPPLTYLAAKRLVDTVRSGDVVAILSGAADDTVLVRGETDGPLGAAVLGRALEVGLGAKPIFLTEERFQETQVATCVAAGYWPIDDWGHAYRRPFSAFVQPLPIDDNEALTAAREFLTTFKPKAIVAVEKLGPNRKGVFHSVQGVDFSHVQAKSHHLFELGHQAGTLTIGIGDGGNELGFGMIFDRVRELTPYGATCRCPCGDGVATRVGADVLVVGAVSNWGCYGIAAALAFLLRNEEVLHTEDEERRMLDACIRAGGADGLYGMNIPFVDGIPAHTQTALLQILRTIVNNGLREVRRKF